MNQSYRPEGGSIVFASVETGQVEIVTEAPGLHEALAAPAAAARPAYADADLRVRSSGIVHAAAMTRWLSGERTPGPARTGFR